MEKLKTPSELCEADSRNLFFVVMDPKAKDGTRASVVADRYIEMEALALPPTIPERIANPFVIAQNLWMYGWFHWPFYALAGFHAYRCMETALRFREDAEIRSNRLSPLTKGRHRSFRNLFEIAVRQGWIRDTGFEHFHRLDERREQYEENMRDLGWIGAAKTAQSPTAYSTRLATSVPQLRNIHAHGDAPIALLFGDTRLALELARDLIIQVVLPVGSEPGGS